MNITRLDIAFAGKPDLSIGWPAGLPGASAAPAVTAGTVFRRAAVVPLIWIDTTGCEVVVELEAQGTVTGPVTVSAQLLATNAGLGPLGPRVIAPVEWQQGRCTLRFPLSIGQLAADGVNEYFVQWEWFDSTGAAPLSLGVSNHLLFVTLAPPFLPWSFDNDPVSRPTALALRTACQFGRYQTEERGLVARLLLALRSPDAGFPRLAYSPDVTEYIFRGQTEPQLFAFHELVADLWSGHVDQPITLCCIEFTCTLIALANLLGCTTMRVGLQLDSDCSPFTSLQLFPLGSAAPSSFNFCHHELCVIGGEGLGSDSLVFDPPFLVRMVPNGGSTPVWRIVDGLPLGSAASPVGQTAYLPHLLAPDQLAHVHVFDAGHPVIARPMIEEPTPVCIRIRYDAFLALLLAMVPPTKPLPLVIRLGGLEPLPATDLPPRMLPPDAARRRTFYRKGGTSRPVVQVDVWPFADQDALARFVARYVARREVAYTATSIDGIATFESSSRKAIVQVHHGAAVRILRLSDQAPESEQLAQDAANLNPA